LFGIPLTPTHNLRTLIEVMFLEALADRLIHEVCAFRFPALGVVVVKEFYEDPQGNGVTHSRPLHVIHCDDVVILKILHFGIRQLIQQESDDGFIQRGSGALGGSEGCQASGALVVPTDIFGVISFVAFF